MLKNSLICKKVRFTGNILQMKFTTSDNDINNAIDVLDKLINQKNSSNVMETLRRYKNTGSIDMFTSYRLNKQLKKIERGL